MRRRRWEGFGGAVERRQENVLAWVVGQPACLACAVTHFMVYPAATIEAKTSRHTRCILRPRMAATFSMSTHVGFLRHTMRMASL